MENIKISGTDRHPEIDFDYSTNRFSIRGFSYPENVKNFYDPIIEPFIDHLAGLEGGSLDLECAFNYFHSSSAQVLYRIFDAMEICGARGNSMTITWAYEAGDDNMQEAGEDFAEDLENVQLILKEIDPS